MGMYRDIAGKSGNNRSNGNIGGTRVSMQNVEIHKHKKYYYFYTLGKYPKEFRRDYFSYMERGKGEKPSFKETLSYFLKYGTLEVSFSSKLIHTLDLEQPIWDRNVTDKHFGYKIPANSIKD